MVDGRFDWQGDAPLQIPLEALVIYEVHLKGFTAHSSSAVANPGTYLGFIEKIPYLKALGINAVEFLPIHEHCIEDFLADRGLTNYWGYNTIGFFAPESSYGTRRFPGCQVEEFKTLVRELHRVGIEVILDVVYNHFRFDLASVLGREEGMFLKCASFFDAISQDPVLARVRLIAEPWDLGTYQVGNFPVDWSEWNGRFRDTVRRFGKGGGGQAQELGWRLTGSADLYGDDGRSARTTRSTGSTGRRSSGTATF